MSKELKSSSGFGGALQLNHKKKQYIRERDTDEKQTVTLSILLKLLIASYFITGILLLLLAMVLYKFHISDSVVTAAIIIIYVISTFFTGLLAGKRIGNRKYFWGLCLGGMYFAVLLIISFIIKRSFADLGQNFLLTMFLCLASGMLGGMVS